MLYVEKYSDRYYNVLIVCTDSGVTGWSLKDDSVFVTSNGDNIVDIVSYGNYYFAVVLKDGRYVLNEYYKDLVLLNTFDLPDSNDSACVIIEGGILYVLQSGNLYRYII